MRLRNLEGHARPCFASPGVTRVHVFTSYHYYRRDKEQPMKFSELSSLPVVNLYAGDLPDMPEYRTTQQVGLSLTQEDKWHIRHDVSKPLPISDESVDTYQSEDVFEHIEYEKIPATISEVHRVLKKGGLFRLSVPDY